VIAPLYPELFNDVFGPLMQPGASRPGERPPGNLI